MIKSLTYFTIICDDCGIDANAESEQSAWSNTNGAECSAECSDWHTDDKKHYCPNCYLKMEDEE